MTLLTTEQLCAAQETSTYKLFTPPKPAGYWVLGAGGYGQTMFSIYVKPTGEQIANTEQLLGWKWQDEPAALKGEV